MSKIKRSVSHMLALFPFELALYEAAKVPVTYVGHPLADIIPIKVDTKSAREALRLEKHSMVVAMLPGSRVGEVSRLAELFVETTFQISKQREDTLFLVPLITRETKDIFEKVLFDRIASLDESEVTPNVRIMFGHSHLAMQAADVVIVASGTATLEAALLKKPMVITYKMPWFSWQILKRLNYLPYVGLPNILAGRFVVPELLQKDANPEKLSSTVLEMMATENSPDNKDAPVLDTEEEKKLCGMVAYILHCKGIVNAYRDMKKYEQEMTMVQDKNASIEEAVITKGE
jgi:lipid-A-disaccharide synthase